MSIQRISWDANVQAAFGPICYDGGDLWRRVESGDAELWRVEESDCSGYLATQVFPDLLFVWCFAGRGSIALLRRIGQLAKSNGLANVGFFSLHAATRRVLGPAADVRKTDVSGEYEFRISSEVLCDLQKTLPERLLCAQSAVTLSPRSPDSRRL